MSRTLLHTVVSVAVLLGALGLAQAATIRVSPFEELSLCLPFNVRVAHPSSGDAAYSVVVQGDQEVIAAIGTNRTAESRDFSNVDPQGALFVYVKNGSTFSSSTPVEVTVFLPPGKLKVLDVTMGTSVSLADGFQIAPEQGVWNVPAGAVLYAPHVAVSSLSMTTTTNNSAFGDPGHIVWTNARNNTDHLQAVSMQGPVSFYINSTTGPDGVQNFLVQPYGALSDASLTGTYANISMLADAASLAVEPRASLRDLYSFAVPCKAKCPLRLFLCSFGNGCNTLSPEQSQGYNYAETIPAPFGDAGAPFEACTSGVENYQCNSDNTTSTCSANSA